MKAEKWEAYLAISRKVETGGRGDDYTDPKQLEWLVNLFAERIPPSQYRKVLDVGAGAGSETWLLKNRGYEVTGITLGADNVRTAKERFNIDLLEMDMHDLSFPVDSFDAALMVQTFEHALSWYILLGELYYVLRDGGRVMVDIPNPAEDDMHTIWHTNLLYPKQVTECFEYWGFKHLEETGEDDNRWQLFYEKRREGDPEWKMYGYLQHILRLRRSVSNV